MVLNAFTRARGMLCSLATGLMLTLRLSSVHASDVVPMQSDKGTKVINIVLDGDSIPAGFGSTKGHSLADQITGLLTCPVKASVTAVGGDPISARIAAFDFHVRPLYDDDGINAILFHAGDNDLRIGHSAVQAYGDFIAYTQRAHEQGWLVIETTELQRYDYIESKQIDLIKLNESIRHNDAKADAIVDLDLNSEMGDKKNRHNTSLYYRDGIHPSDGGYAILARLIADKIASIVYCSSINKDR